MADETFDADIEEVWPEKCGLCGLCGVAVGPGLYACPSCGATWRKVPTTGPVFAVARAATGFLFVAGMIVFAAFLIVDWIGLRAESLVALAVSIPMVLAGTALGKRLDRHRERTSRFEWDRI